MITIVDVVENHFHMDLSEKSLSGLRVKLDPESARLFCIELFRSLDSQEEMPRDRLSEPGGRSTFWYPDRNEYPGFAIPRIITGGMKLPDFSKRGERDPNRMTRHFSFFGDPTRCHPFSLTPLEKELEDKQLKNVLLYYDHVTVPISLPFAPGILGDYPLPLPPQIHDHMFDLRFIHHWVIDFLSKLAELREIVSEGALELVWDRRADYESYQNAQPPDNESLPQLPDEVAYIQDTYYNATHLREALERNMQNMPNVVWTDLRNRIRYCSGVLGGGLIIPSVREADCFKLMVKFQVDSRAKVTSNEIMLPLSASMLSEANLPGLDDLTWHDIVAVRRNSEGFARWRSEIRDVLTHVYNNQNLYTDIGRELVEYARDKLRPTYESVVKEVESSNFLSNARTTGLFFFLGALIAFVASGGKSFVTLLSGGGSSALRPFFESMNRVSKNGRLDSILLPGIWP